jgi:hypothetical protein
MIRHEEKIHVFIMLIEKLWKWNLDTLEDKYEEYSDFFCRLCTPISKSIKQVDIYIYMYVCMYVYMHARKIILPQTIGTQMWGWETTIVT